MIRNRKKPTVLVIGHLPPPQEGTAELTKIIVNSRELNENFDIKFLALLKRRAVANRGKLGIANIIHNLVNVFNYFVSLFRFRPEMVYMPLAQNRFGFFRDSLFVIIGKIFQRKLCVHFHGGSFDLFYKFQPSAVKSYIRFVIRRITRLVLLADKFKEQFAPFLPKERMVSLYNCVSLIPDQVRNSKQSVFRDKPSKILFVGYLSKAKGALDVAQAAVIILTKYRQDVEFALCGQPVDIERNIIFIKEPHSGYSKIVDLIRKHDLEDNICLHPEILTEKKTTAFSEADIFVLPSYSAGCALVVLEAMSFGLPIITTPVGALEEMITEGRNCLFVEPGDVIDLSEKILFLLDNPDIARTMGKENQRLIKEKYNSDVFLRNLSCLWSDALQEGVKCDVES